MHYDLYCVYKIKDYQPLHEHLLLIYTLNDLSISYDNLFDLTIVVCTYRDDKT